jgi:hypothetical protein
LNDKMAGFYRSSYIDAKSGEKKWLATTQMGNVSSPIFAYLEPTDARRAFPCWVRSTGATFDNRMSPLLKRHLKLKLLPIRNLLY